MMGCPIGANKRLANGAERQRFANGEIAWSPDQGHRMVVSAWERNGYAYVTWGPTNPYSYDVFLVRYTSAADAGAPSANSAAGTRAGCGCRSAPAATTRSSSRAATSGPAATGASSAGRCR